MKAVGIARNARGVAFPELREFPEPVPSAREVLVQVHAAGLNRADLGLKTGHFQAMAGSGSDGIAGLEMAGEVLRCGSDASRFRTGDRVMAMCSGAHAQRVCVDERLLMRIPDNVDVVRAAALPAALMTAHDALVSNGRFQRGDHVLVQAASSVIGLASAQLARLLGASHVIGTSSSADKRERLHAMGLSHVIDGGPGLAKSVDQITNGHGVDVVVDLIGTPALAENMASAAVGARIVNVGRMGGSQGKIDLDLLSLKRLQLIGVTFRTRTVDEVARLIEQLLADVGPLLAANLINVPIDRIFALRDVCEAHAWMTSRPQFGKVVLQL